MRYLCVFKAVEATPPSADEMQAMGALIGKMVSAGVLLATEGRMPARAVDGANGDAWQLCRRKHIL